MKKALIIGISGQDGSLLANYLFKKSVVLDNNNMNPILFTKLVEIEQDKGQPELYCL